MKQQKVERFLLEPSYTPLFGVTVYKDTDITDETESGEVKQTIKNLKLTTKVKRKVVREEYEYTEKSEIVIKLKEGARLLWTESEGYILPTQKLVSRKEIKKI